MGFLRKIPSVLKNFFFLFSIGFAAWMFFLDANNLPAQFERNQDIRELEEQKIYYQQGIKEVRQSKEEIENNDAVLEQIAREEYLMKKPTEDVYVLEEH